MARQDAIVKKRRALGGRRIFKMQISLSTTEKDYQILVYDESREILTMDKATPDQMQYPIKSFWSGALRPDGKIVLDRMLPEKDWPQW